MFLAKPASHIIKMLISGPVLSFHLDRRARREEEWQNSLDGASGVSKSR